MTYGAERCASFPYVIVLLSSFLVRSITGFGRVLLFLISPWGWIHESVASGQIRAYTAAVAVGGMHRSRGEVAAPAFALIEL
jgi:hypothetical protein